MVFKNNLNLKMFTQFEVKKTKRTIVWNGGSTSYYLSCVAMVECSVFGMVIFYLGWIFGTDFIVFPRSHDIRIILNPSKL